VCEQTQGFQVLQEIVETVTSTLDLQAVLQKIVQLVSQVTAADACLLYLLEESAHTLVLGASKPAHPKSIGRLTLHIGEGLTGWVAQERRPIAIERQAFNDPRFKAFQQLPEDRYEAFLSTPIMSRDRLVGVINVQRRKPHRYSQETVTLIETIGRLVGGTIANAQLYQTSQQRQRELEALSKVSEAVVSERYLDEILQLIITVTAELMSSKICSLMLFDEAQRALVIRATQSLSPAYRNKPPIKIGESISGRVIKERKPLSVLDVATAPGYRYPEVARQEGLKSLLSVPMMIKDRAIGVLNLYTATEHRFTAREVQLLSTIANQAAAAIEHTRLLEQSVALQKSLEDRKLIERAKGILMRELRCQEPEAFKRLQKQSMERRKSMRDVAEAVILASEMQEKA